MFEIIRSVTVLAIVGFIIGLIVRTNRVVRRRDERRCNKKTIIDGTTYTCRHTTTRRHLMVPATNVTNKKFQHFWEPRTERFGAWFHPYTFDECGDKSCGHVRHVKGRPEDSKFFDSIEIAWRRFWDPKQFDPNEDLLIRADCLPKRSTTSTSQRLRHHAAQLKEYAGREKARLDKLSEPVKVPGWHPARLPRAVFIPLTKTSTRNQHVPFTFFGRTGPRPPPPE